MSAGDDFRRLEFPHRPFRGELSHLGPVRSVVVVLAEYVHLVDVDRGLFQVLAPYVGQ